MWRRVRHTAPVTRPTVGYTGTPSGIGYYDPYYGSRAPEYLNWTFGIQRQLTNAMTLTATYVGSEGHFLQLDSFNARGYWSNQLDPKYLGLGIDARHTGREHRYGLHGKQPHLPGQLQHQPAIEHGTEAVPVPCGQRYVRLRGQRQLQRTASSC